MSQCFGWRYEKYHTSKIHVENKSELLQKENKDLLANSFVSRYQEQSMLTKKTKEFLASAVFKDAASGNHLFRKDPPPSKQSQCLDLYQSRQVSILQMTKALGHLTTSIQVVLPARMHGSFLQQQ